MDNSKLCRIAVFYDGNYFFNVSNYYLYQHPRHARIAFDGLHEFIKAEVAKHEGIDIRHAQIVDASYFRGRLTAQQAQDEDKLFKDRVFEDVLMRANITLFQRHLKAKFDGGYAEKGIDVWLALEAYEMASLKKYDVCVLVAGDSDFVPLVNKLNTLGSRVMLVAWDFSYMQGDGNKRTTRTATELIERANYPIMMDTEIDSRERRRDPLIDNIFVEIKTSTEDEARPPQPMPRSSQSSATPQNVNQPIMDGQKTEGPVVTLHPDKGFGFIKAKDGGDNFFFHFRDLRGIESSELHLGVNVSFIAGRNAQGRSASEVTRT